MYSEYSFWPAKRSQWHAILTCWHILLFAFVVQALQQLKDKSKRESFKPFDRSFLLKRHPSSEDIFRGASRLYEETISDLWDVEIQKLWKEDGDLSGKFEKRICNLQKLFTNSWSWRYSILAIFFQFWLYLQENINSLILGSSKI